VPASQEVGLEVAEVRIRTGGATAAHESGRSAPFEQLLGIEDPPTLIERVADCLRPADCAPAVISHPGTAAAQWLTGTECRLLARPCRTAGGERFATFRDPSGQTFSCLDHGDGRIELPFSMSEAYENFVLERWVSHMRFRRLSPRVLELYYRCKPLIPRALQLSLRRLWTAVKGTPTFPRWPHDDSVERLARFYGACVLRATRRSEVSFRWFWPNGAHAAAILTHDVEGASGMRNALRVAEIDGQYGFRSSFNIVGNWYPIDWGVIRELSARGHEIGSHALHHDRSLFSSRAEFERQLPALRRSVTELGASGFRSPATHRVPEWLAELPVDYDVTMPFSDPYEAQPGGTCSAWPFFIGPVLEMPYTLPQDHTLFTLMRRKDSSVWVEQMLRLKRHFGLIQCVSHPDVGYLADHRNEIIYRGFLEALRSQDDLWHALPRDVSRWWRARAGGESLPGLSLGRGRFVAGPGSTLAVIQPPEK
jgi:peptidoglycan/xylan/chitin deacetylase (PgdA/CDA1 family)